MLVAEPLQAEVHTESITEEPTQQESRAAVPLQAEARTGAEDVPAHYESAPQGDVITETTADEPIQHESALQVNAHAEATAEVSSRRGVRTEEPQDDAVRPSSPILARPIRMDASSVRILFPPLSYYQFHD